jgi:hypothetical protein
MTTMAGFLIVSSVFLGIFGALAIYNVRLLGGVAMLPALSAKHPTNVAQESHTMAQSSALSIFP